ncbi:hypothetical protein I4U23_013485 [Adineta vaga]|nr:hypothetical protein I4U23_013485 [Adineta vaga]
MLIIFLLLTFQHIVYSEDVCNSVYCGSGICIETQNPTLPYYCRCQNGSNTILPCPSEDPCSQSPCGQGICEVVPNLLYGYVCRCDDDSVTLTSCNVTHDVCASNPCINGLCIEGLTSFICNCLPTWTGRLCDSKCFPINDPSFPYVCLCPDGEFATSCQKTTMQTITTTTSTSTVTTSTFSQDICKPLTHEGCKNGGQCLIALNGNRCFCPSDYTGRFCENKINSCQSYPCLYGGICYNLQSSFICACPDGSFRSQCLPTTVSTSAANLPPCPCRNGGVCSDIDSPKCTCPNGFTGPLCENVLYNSCQEVKCLNGGTCYENSAISADASYCLCKHGYTGQFCEIEYFRCRSNGRFTDQYNCKNGKYFECVHYYEDGSKTYAQLLSRDCPPSLRYNVLTDRCDYPRNVQC